MSQTTSASVCVCVGGGWKQQIWAARCITSWILTSHLITWTRLGPFHVSQCRKSFYQYRSHISQLPMSHTSLGSLSSRRLLTHSEMWLQIHLVLLVYLRGAGRGGGAANSKSGLTCDDWCNLLQELQLLYVSLQTVSWYKTNSVEWRRQHIRSTTESADCYGLLKEEFKVEGATLKKKKEKHLQFNSFILLSWPLLHSSTAIPEETRWKDREKKKTGSKWLFAEVLFEDGLKWRWEEIKWCNVRVFL